MRASAMGLNIRPVSVLYARSDSLYKDMCADVWDIERDARNWPGGNPVVAHPPCRAWGRLRQFAKPRKDEKQLALHAVECVRNWGGVLEHPRKSTLWEAADLPLPGRGFDAFGGWTFEIYQKDFGHVADKATWLYICGLRPAEITYMPLVLGDAEKVITTSLRRGEPGFRTSCTEYEREYTPVALANWLLSVASRCAWYPL
jgi:hypothetical protein